MILRKGWDSMNGKYFLKALSRMINEDDTPFPALWKQVPKKYQKDFKSWCQEYKQQTWDRMWEKGWFSYHLEYVRFIIEEELDDKL
ncbi:hypothetical protein A2Z67_04645 [Candidatus Woesebacteria bacterium RBG_13_36_22]|uniref:Uncharacterized protein n=1 Tax=Candidatus Woesebacteria bacterium RBG_13_36_22 TaxID=1802478 RepID=A0A1F7X2K6_9BACT|nr:MAG: hypothetical protein A2Z67_04645 [Candidatus Woesebacteria bacterium RBG_13_36_22]